VEKTTRQTWAEIDLSAIKHNVIQAKKKVGDNVRVMAVVKANGYGHGAERVAKAALEAGAEYLGVAIPEEGDALRAAGVSQPILVLAEPSHLSIPIVIKNDLIATVCTNRTAEALSKQAVRQNKQVKIHIKIDTGMSRIGLAPENATEFIQKISRLPGIEIEGIFTHFTEADIVKSGYTAYQLDRFRSLINELEDIGICPRIRHAANSAGVYLHPASHLDMVRIGISIYGLHPSDATKNLVDLKPALSLKARLSFVKRVKGGAGISYNRTYITREDTIIATVPIGYGDGYSRLLSNKASVLVGGQRFKVVGNICMDQLMVDLGLSSAASFDDEAVLIGRQEDKEITVDEIAGLIGTISYEVVCMINARVPRVYKE
jgi:alanine racemase